MSKKIRKKHFIICSLLSPVIYVSSWNNQKQSMKVQWQANSSINLENMKEDNRTYQLVEINFSNEVAGLNSMLDSTMFKVCHGIGSFLLVLIAFFCYTGFIHYESYGGDPMKRSKWYIKKVKHKIIKYQYLFSLIK